MPVGSPSEVEACCCCDICWPCFRGDDLVAILSPCKLVGWDCRRGDLTGDFWF
jgi:hypothetical protein